jgi:hypothetical protein
MASKIDKLRLEHSTALVKQQTAKIELRARWVQLMVAGVTLATATREARRAERGLAGEDGAARLATTTVSGRP